MKLIHRNLPVLLLLISSNLVAQEYTLPIQISKNKRYLTDQKGTPFLYFSDSGWHLFDGLSVPEARQYFLKRKEQGFSVVHVFLTPMPGKTNRKGMQPFQDFDFSKPNEAFFDETEKYIRLADSLNICLAVVPLWYSCCNDGWGSHPAMYMKKNGTGKCFEFGKYVGNRYKKFKNIIWIMGGDNDPQDNREEVSALASGIKQTSPNQLMTYHALTSHSSTDVWDNAKWLDFSMVYTYFRGMQGTWNSALPDVYEVCYTEYMKLPIMPFILGESTYEGEHDEHGSAQQIRKQAYWTMLCGGAGHSYGSPFWAVESSKVRGEDWRKILDLEGANTLKYLNKLFTLFDWTGLEPQFPITPQPGYAQNDFATTALTADKKTLVSYIPSSRVMKYDLLKLSGNKIDVKEFNPRTGEIKLLATVTKSKTVRHYTYESPDKSDWVVLLQVKD